MDPLERSAVLTPQPKRGAGLTTVAPVTGQAIASPTELAHSWRLGRLAWVALLLIVLCVLAGFIPRWRQRATLRVETRELAIPTVSVIAPAPGKTAPGLTLPAEIKPL